MTENFELSVTNPVKIIYLELTDLEGYYHLIIGNKKHHNPKRDFLRKNKKMFVLNVVDLQSCLMQGENTILRHADYFGKINFFNEFFETRDFFIPVTKITFSLTELI